MGHGFGELKNDREFSTGNVSGSIFDVNVIRCVQFSLLFDQFLIFGNIEIVHRLGERRHEIGHSGELFPLLFVLFEGVTERLSEDEALFGFCSNEFGFSGLWEMRLHIADDGGADKCFVHHNLGGSVG